MPEIIGGVEILTPEEASKFLKIKRSKLYQLVADCKNFPFHKAGEGSNASLRFFKHELIEWLSKR